ncbi:MAG: hypothetical protein HXO44_05930 [Prevotella sp.]|nr:hypothetical protein [Prevotella sp.]
MGLLGLLEHADPVPVLEGAVDEAVEHVDSATAEGQVARAVAPWGSY